MDTGESQATSISKTAYLRIAEARIQVQSARAQGMPNLNASALLHTRAAGACGNSEIAGHHGRSSASPLSTSAAHLVAREPVNLYQLGFDASWELDLFGKVRRAVEAADAQSAVAVESRNDLLDIPRGGGGADVFSIAGEPNRLRQITLDSSPSRAKSLDLTDNRHFMASPGSPMSIGARANSRVSNPNCPRTSKRSRPRGMRWRF